MIDLGRLKSKQKTLFLGEVAGLLHNLGKLSSDFIKKAADPENTPYEFDRVVDPGKVPQLAKLPSLIRSKLWIDLVHALCQGWNWGPIAKASGALEKCLPGLRHPRSLNGTRDALKEAYKAAASISPSDPSSLCKARNLLASAVALAALVQKRVKSASDLLNSKEHDFLLNTKLKVLDEMVSLGELILLMWDDYHGWPHGQHRDPCLEIWTGTSSILQRYLTTSHGVVSGSEKAGSKSKGQTDTAQTLIASPFGSEPRSFLIDVPTLDMTRTRWLSQVVESTTAVYVAAANSWSQFREKLYDSSEPVLRSGLGETRRPLNDVTLWDYSTSVAALFKAAVAKAILEKHFAKTSDLRWQLLSVRYDGLAYLSQSHHISDLLARRDAALSALEEVRVLIEVEYPLGAEIYRDENGSVFVVPHVEYDGREQNLLSLPVGDEGTLGQIIVKRFSAAKVKSKTGRPRSSAWR